MIHEPQDRVVDTLWQRRRMVEEQLRPRGISDLRVIAAMRSVAREEFVPDDLRDAAYEDGPLPIGYDQTISQPFTVAFMCQALQLRGREKVLEIGAGSGYSAAVLSQLAHEVFTIERIPELAEEARQRLRQLRYQNVHVLTGDGTRGLREEAPFDAIVVTAGAEFLPDAYVQQLCDGGRIVIPIGPLHSGQTMQRFTRFGNELASEELGSFSFVPLIGEHGWSRSKSDSFAQ
jgi:protein-L-isoaspartate(D-aspartate) O-methyltransferase